MAEIQCGNGDIVPYPPTAPGRNILLAPEMMSMPNKGFENGGKDKGASRGEESCSLNCIFRHLIISQSSKSSAQLLHE